MNRRLVAITALAFVLTACATGASVRQVKLDLARVSSDVTELRHAQDLTASELARTTAELRTLQTRNAEIDAALRQQSTDSARLRARMDGAEQEWRAGRLPERLPASAPAGPAAAAPTVAVAATPSSPVRQATARPLDDADRTYNAALANFRAREHGQAVLDFLDFIARYPGHAEAPSAQYWIGEAYYAQRDYRQAIVEFERVVTMAPTAFVAADALLKIGMARTNLRENSRAQQVWRRLVREYPGSESAGKARVLLREHAARRP